MSLEKRNLIVLTHFSGHPSLGEDEMNNYRYEYLKEILFNPYSEEEYVLISNHSLFDKKIIDIKLMSDIENKHEWIKIPEEAGDTISREDVENYLAKYGFSINKVYVGGVNTAGCVIEGKGWSALNWAKAGYDTVIVLALCGEYQMSGTPYERSLKTFERIYQKIRDENVVDKVNVVYKIEEGSL